MSPPERLYNLLPALYRVRDAGAQGQPLRALLAVIESEMELLEGDIERLYDNWFIETCEEWVVPYIGDLLGVRGLQNGSLLPPLTGEGRDGGGAFSQRALVANTLAYRRRKGTVAVLEQLARDVTGWPAKAVEFFELLAATQYLNHLRPTRGRTLDLRDTGQLELINGPFEQSAHTADVRHVDNGRGKYNIPNVGLYLWRLQSYLVERSAARPVANPPDGRYTFSPLGYNAPLFNRPRTETEITQLAAEHNVPGLLRRRPLYQELESLRQPQVDGGAPRRLYFGDQPVIQVYERKAPNAPFELIPAEQLRVCDLSDPPPPAPPPADWRRPHHPPIRVAVDPVTGRLAFPAGVIPAQVDVTYAYGFSGDLGGGPYDRQASVAGWLDRFKPVTWQMGVTQAAPANHTQLVKTLAEAVRAWNKEPPQKRKNGIIAVMDNGAYAESLAGADAIVIPAGCRLAIVAADWPDVETPDGLGQKERVLGEIAPVGRRPLLSGNMSVRGAAPEDDTVVDRGELVLDGLLVEGKITVSAGNLGSLLLSHCTVVPGKGLLEVVSDNVRLDVTLERTICGPVNLPPSVGRLRVLGSIVDGAGGAAITGPGAAADIQTATVFGTTTVKSLEAGNCIFTGKVRVVRRQTGCVGFSYLPVESVAPRRYRCQPANAISALRLFPQFTSVIYGHPGYGQLAPACPREIITGAQDEGEMGAFHFLQQPQRIAGLRNSLDEYLPSGLEAGLFFVT